MCVHCANTQTIRRATREPRTRSHVLVRVYWIAPRIPLNVHTLSSISQHLCTFHGCMSELHCHTADHYHESVHQHINVIEWIERFSNELKPNYCINHNWFYSIDCIWSMKLSRENDVETNIICSRVSGNCGEREYINLSSSSICVFGCV